MNDNKTTPAGETKPTCGTCNHCTQHRGAIYVCQLHGSGTNPGSVCDKHPALAVERNAATAGELTDAQIKEVAGECARDALGATTLLRVCRAIIAADRALHAVPAGDAGMPPQGFQYRFKYRVGPNYGPWNFCTQEDLTLLGRCENHETRTLITLADAQAALAVRDAEIAQLTREVESWYSQNQQHIQDAVDFAADRDALKGELDNALALWTVAQAERSDALMRCAKLDGEIVALRKALERIAAHEALKAQAEPVALLEHVVGGSLLYAPIAAAAYKLPMGVQYKLYTAPPTQVPLTPQQIDATIRNYFADDWAIEKAREMLLDFGIAQAVP